MSASQTVTPELRQWIVEQAQAGCRPEDVLASMRASGWDEVVALGALGQVLEAFLGAQAVQQAATLAATLPPAVRVPEPALAGSPSQLRVHDREVRVLLTLQNPRVVVFGGFLSDDECDDLVAAAAPRMVRSETVVNETGGNEVNAARTSDGMFFGRGESALCQRIEARIAALLNWPLVNGEGLQVLHYRPGAEYKPHHDYFDPAQPGMAAVLKRGGQRVGTLVMYLNTPLQGGGTVFPDVQLEVAPIKGNAVFFSYERAHASTRTLHGGAPVIAGDKWVATKWLREGEFI
ncbi:MAG: proline dioxygenase [Burkholderiales bacterium RIFCSPHIGHO2_12_FULL_69_20]|nr:MAG: proline dioxygenase [Burkholderiales bacterium RIFCSPHIGHO2_12_FULL_69_20]